jgi:hypothetical protein
MYIQSPNYDYPHNKLTEEYNPEKITTEIQQMKHNLTEINNYISKLNEKLSTMSPVTWVYWITTYKGAVQGSCGPVCEYYFNPDRAAKLNLAYKYEVVPRKANTVKYEVEVYRCSADLYNPNYQRQNSERIDSLTVYGSENKKLFNDLIDAMLKKYPEIENIPENLYK